MKNNILQDGRYYCFDSDLQRRISSALPLRDPDGRDLLSTVLHDTRFVIILFTNRSGSNLVTDMLESSNVGSGLTHEPFLSDVILKECSKNGYASLEEYFVETVMAWRRGGYFFLKMGWDSLFWLMAQDFLPDVLKRSHIVLTERRDKIAQAISYYKALSSGRFFRLDGPTEAAPSSILPDLPQDPVLDDQTASSLLELVNHFYVSEYRLRYFLDLHGLDALRLVYEDFSCHLADTRHRILRHLGFDESRISGLAEYRPRLLKQSDHTDDALKSALLRRIRL